MPGAPRERSSRAANPRVAAPAPQRRNGILLAAQDLVPLAAARRLREVRRAMWATLKHLSLGMVLIVAASAVLLLSDVDRRQSGSRRVPRIAILQHASQPALDEGVTGMLDGLAANGLVEGTTVSIRRYNAENDLATANTIAKAFTAAGDVELTADRDQLVVLVHGALERRDLLLQPH